MVWRIQRRIPKEMTFEINGVTQEEIVNDVPAEIKKNMKTA